MVMKKREQVFALLLHLQCLLFPVDALLFMQQERLRSLHLCAWNEELPESVVSSLADRGVTQMLPVQQSAWKVVKERLDAVISSPTATGKTLAYVVPLIARLVDEEALKKEALKEETKKRSIPMPRVVVLAPSRELVQQIGREFSFVAKAFGEEGCLATAVACGGMPMERSVAGLRARGGADVVVATPGRLAELLRAKQLSFRKLETLVLDEADALLDEDDVPEVRRFLDGMENDYQLLLFSATITDKVRSFARGLMELDHSAGQVDILASRRAKLNHFALAASETEWSVLCADLLLTLLENTSTAIVFVRTIAMAQELSDYLTRALRHSRVLALHSDLAPAARKRAVYHLSNTEQYSTILVATDIAARGLDLPGVDLVLQLGLPRQRGRDGTLDTDLYAHRSGRAGREANSTSTSIVLFDPTNAENKLLPHLLEFLNSTYQYSMQLILPPSSFDLAQAASALATNLCARVSAETLDTFSTSDQLNSQYLPTSAIVVLAGLDCLPTGTIASSRLTSRSLLTARTVDRTLCLRPNRQQSYESIILSASAVTRAFKLLGSGKVPSVKLVHGAAYLDFPAHRAHAIRENAIRNPDLLPPKFELLLLPEEDPDHVFPWIEYSTSPSDSSGDESPRKSPPRKKLLKTKSRRGTHST